MQSKDVSSVCVSVWSRAHIHTHTHTCAHAQPIKPDPNRETDKVKHQRRTHATRPRAPSPLCVPRASEVCTAITQVTGLSRSTSTRIHTRQERPHTGKEEVSTCSQTSYTRSQTGAQRTHTLTYTHTHTHTLYRSLSRKYRESHTHKHTKHKLNQHPRARFLLSFSPLSLSLLPSR